MIPLLLPPMMKAYPLEESYLLPDDLICQPIWYVTVSLTLFLFFSLYYSAHQSTYDWLLCSIVSFYFGLKSFLNFLISHQRFCHACMCFNFCKYHFFQIPDKVDSAFSRALLTPPLLWAASQRTIGSWYCTIWTLHSGGHHTDVLFADEDEEGNDGCWGFCLLFFLLHLKYMVEARSLMCLEIDMQNESWW